MSHSSRLLTVAALAALAVPLTVPASLDAQRPDYNRRGIQVGQHENLTLSLGIHSIGRVQMLSQEDVHVWDGSSFREQTNKLGSGMHTSFANLEFMITIGEDIDVFFDGLLATQRHPTQWWGHQGYMYIRQIPDGSPLDFLNPLFEHVDVKAGNFYANFGEHQFTRTLNADAHRNPLVGNPVVSPVGTEPGMEFYVEREGLGVMVGGGIGAPEHDFQEARKWSYRGKVWVDAIEGLYLSGSYYSVSHDPGIRRGSNLYRRERLGSSYASVWNRNNDNGGDGEGPGQVRPGDGRELAAWELNAIATLFPGNRLAAFVGGAEASGPNPALPGADKGDEEWVNYAVEATQYLADSPVYLSGRYSAIDYSKFITDDNDGKVSRIQIGGGLWVTDNILMKAEYVYQSASGFLPETVGVANWVDVGRDPVFKGLILEVGMSF